MERGSTPKWLIDVQQKSWEPEILISGITLTFIFILSNHIYNFFGMLVQDFAVTSVIAYGSYILSTFIITGLKIILVIHLILRGLWTGFVGLSYVFPDGVKKEKMRPEMRKVEFDKPEKFVIRLEEICSLLFSFIFSSVTVIVSFSLMWIPMIFLYIIGLDQEIVRKIILFIIIPVGVLFGVYLIITDKRRKYTKTKQRSNNFIFSNLLTTYVTNLGILKTGFIFILYFLVIFLISFSNITGFDFINKKGRKISSLSKITCLNNNQYDELRDRDLRIPKAAIDKFQILDNKLKLFIGYYKEDLFTVKKLKEKPGLLNEFKIVPDSSGIKITDLLKLSIDGKNVYGLNWYIINQVQTGQKVLTTDIDLENITEGYHELKIDKFRWSVDKKKLKLIENWDIIPFEKTKKNKKSG